MTWGRFDDRYPSNRKIGRLSDAAFRLDVSGILWSSENLTDGRIAPDELGLIPKIKRPKACAAELVEKGRWHISGHLCERCPQVDDGWIIHDYHEYNPTAEKVREEKQAKAKRQRKWLDKRKMSRDASQDTSGGGSKDGAPSPPRPEGGGGTGSPRADAVGRAHPSGSPVRVVPDWCGECDERTRLVGEDSPRRCPDCHPLRHEESA
jgi:hypothetical protein